MHFHVPQQRELTEVPAAHRRSAPAGQRRGVLISTPVEGGREQAHDVVSCCHCGRAWVYHRGSGRRRGWCGACAKLTCGSRACDVCVTVRQLLDNMAAGMPFAQARQHKPVKASVPAGVPVSPGGVLLGRG